MSDKPGEQGKKAGMEKYFFRASAEDFKKIPGSPIAYWVSHKVRSVFETSLKIKEIANVKQGLATADDGRFLRYWYEVSTNSRENKWIAFTKGGEYRKWAGNLEYVVDWEDDGNAIRKFPRSYIRNETYYFKKGITWTLISSGKPAFRVVPAGCIFGHKGPMVFPKHNELLAALCAFFNSCVARYFLLISSQTLGFEIGHVNALPFVEHKGSIGLLEKLVSLSGSNWNSYETSWDFTTLSLLHPDYRQPTLEATYQKLRAHWQEMTLEMQRLEEENNRIFIEAYGLQDELTPDVPLNEITLTCNPYYRYGKKPQIDTDIHGSEQQKEKISVHPCSSMVQKQFPINDELEAKLLSDTMKEFISYSVGCIFGRYSLDNPGLILANQGETIEDYYRKLREPQIDTDTHGLKKQKEKISVHPCSSVVQPTFIPDEDNVIPILDDDWFIDDIVERFRIFLRTTFGEEHYEENLKFIEDAIGRDIRKYFLKNFYADHVKRYKKRPIYWLFASPKGSFNALIYMHRYQPDTVSIILNDYLREFRTKLIARREHLGQVSISASAKKTEKTRALKEIEKLKKTIEELDIYENEILYPLATEKIEIDLDDGVKVNYKKFGKALKKVTGLS